MMQASKELVGSVFTAVDGVTKRFDRAWYLDAAQQGASTDSMWEVMAQQGLLGIGVPEEYGGSGRSVTGPVAVMHAMSRAGVPSFLYILLGFTRNAIIAAGTEEQKRQWVPSTVNGDLRICFALTEPDAGTNSFNISTRARRTEAGDYRIDGQKVFISGADEADLMMVVARTDTGDAPKLSMFLVDLPTPGLSLQRMDIEMHAPERQHLVFFDDMQVPADRRLGVEGAGNTALFEALNPERFMIAAWALGLGELAAEKGAAYARVRAPFGTPIGAYQAIQHPLADAKMRLEAARLVLYQGCEEYDEARSTGLEANMAKYLATTAARDAVEAAIQAHGGHAWDRQSDVVQLWPMIRLMLQSPINNEMVLNFAAERMLGLPRSY